MPPMLYNSLVIQIQQYCNRYIQNVPADPEFIASIPYFVTQAQQRIWREGKDIGFEKTTVAIGQFNIGQAGVVIQKPPQWNKTLSFIYGTDINNFAGANVLYLRTYEFCRIYWPNNTLTAPPLFYSDHRGANIAEAGGNAYDAYYIAPSPDKQYFYQITYLERPVAIGSGQGEPNTNILTERFPDLLFYACMVEALSYLMFNDQTQIFEGMYQRALKSMLMQTQERYTDRASKRDKD